MNLTITDRAALEVKRIMEEQNIAPKTAFLRVRILGGGCSGFTHKLDLDEVINEKMDETFIINGVDVVVDRRSGMYVDGATIDFNDDFNRRGFVVTNPAAKSTCGCGSSFSM